MLVNVEQVSSFVEECVESLLRDYFVELCALFIRRDSCRNTVSSGSYTQRWFVLTASAGPMGGHSTNRSGDRSTRQVGLWTLLWVMAMNDKVAG